MPKILYLVFYFVSKVWSFPQFKCIKYDNNWKLFQRFGDEACSYYEQSDHSDYFLTFKHGFTYLAYNKNLIEQRKWEKPDCPEVMDGYSIKYSQSIATGIWWKGRTVFDSVKDYDIDTSTEYGKIIVDGKEFSDNARDIECIDLVLQSLGSEVISTSTSSITSTPTIASTKVQTSTIDPFSISNSTGEEESKTILTIIVCSVILSIVAVISVATLAILVKRGMICSKRNSTHIVVKYHYQK